MYKIALIAVTALFQFNNVQLVLALPDNVITPARLFQFNNVQLVQERPRTAGQGGTRFNSIMYN